MALDKAIAVNAAWRTLRDPVKRAEMLLARFGVATGEQKEPKASPALLMEMMEVREELADAQQAKDLDRIGEIADRMRSKERGVLDRLSTGFDAADDKSTLVSVVGELRYVRRFFEELEAIEEQLME